MPAKRASTTHPPAKGTGRATSIILRAKSALPISFALQDGQPTTSSPSTASAVDLPPSHDTNTSILRAVMLCDLMPSFALLFQCRAIFSAPDIERSKPSVMLLKTTM